MMIKEFFVGNINFVLIYFIIINIYSIIITITDKIKAKNHKWRISEFHLMICGFIGGAFSMYVTMKLIRHKTKHKKFMICLPIEIILHILIFVIIFLI